MVTQMSYEFPTRGYPGQRMGDCKAITLNNDLGAVRQVDDITISSAVDDTDYQFTINGILVKIHSDTTGSTVAKIRDALIEKVRSIADFEGVCFANPNGLKVRLTAAVPGTGFTTAESDANLTLANTTANVATTTIPFGAAICKRTGAGTTDKSGGLPTAPTAGVTDITWPGALHADGTYRVSVSGTQGGVPFADAVDFIASTSSLAQIVAGLVAAINGLLPALPIVASNVSNTTVRLTGPGGVSFSVEVESLGTASPMAVTVTTAPSGAIFVGVAERIHSGVATESSAPYSGAFKQGEPMPVIYDGPVMVQTEVAVTAFSDPVFMRHTANGSLVAGGWRNDSDSNKAVRIPRARWLTTTTGAGLAVLDLNAGGGVGGAAI